MAEHTDLSLRQSVIYEIYVRNHTSEGTFRAIEPDLDRIRALGVDIIWFMPIHPIGVENKKGSLGCPYANRDYRTVNPEYGTMEDFKHLVDEIHARGMQCIIDVVYNHTSPDSTLVSEHPEFFYQKPTGGRGNKVGEWTDVVDLDYNVPALWQYQIASLCQWAAIVDGFRCDVASNVPVAFWKAAREAVERVHPGTIWLGESVYLEHVRHFHESGFYCATDSELYEAFDILYSYDIRRVFDDCFAGSVPVSRLMDAVNFQNYVYPKNHIKLRCLENHDQPRAAKLVPDDAHLRVWTALCYFMKGTTLIYAGQEACNTRTPSLFDVDKVDWNTGRDLTPLMQKLYAIRHKLPTDAAFWLETDDEAGIVTATYTAPDKRCAGVFPVAGKPGTVNIPLADGVYSDALTGSSVRVEGGRLAVGTEAVIIL